MLGKLYCEAGGGFLLGTRHNIIIIQYKHARSYNILIQICILKLFEKYS